MIDLMPRKKKVIKDDVEVKKYPRGRDSGEVVYIGAEVMPEIAEALDEYCERNGIKKRFVIESALRDWLGTRGLLRKPM